jgi:two-component system, chemotaxis family, CheB/CheR fusion protein
VADENTELSSGTPGARGLYVVGIGASSGGLAALQVLLGSLPPQPGFACVIVMHLSPEHESHLSELLQQHSQMPVQQVTATVALQRNHVYVIPPNANLDTIDTHLRLTQLEERRIERAPIDHFLRTLALTHEGFAVGIILTGAGSDGSIGLRHIKECGGLTIAQDPEEAAYDSMPRSAIATGMVDLVLPLERIAEETLKFCRTEPQLPLLDTNGALDARDETTLRRILGELQKRTRHDFSIYSRPTLLRRLRRRMRLCHLTSFAAYLEVLTRKPEEADALSDDLLLTPTEFFRDAAAFTELEQSIAQIFARKDGQLGRIRIWSIGCSTGEEAYSLAMLLVEERARWHGGVHLQVFASDLSEKVLATAREGLYPREIAASVSAERLERFFIQQPGYFRVKRELHDIVLFAAHDLFKDPPFAHMDLIVCRSLLSDLQPDVRQGVLSLLHYALDPQGLLLVGTNDAVNAPGLFEALPGPSRLFRRLGAPKRAPKLPSSMQPFGPEGVRKLTRSAPPLASSDIASVHREVMESYAPPSVLVDAENRAVHFSSNASRYLHIPGGELTQDLTHLVREPIRSPLLEGLRVVRTGERKWSSGALAVPTEEGSKPIVLRIEPVISAGLILVVFDDRDSSGSGTRPTPEPAKVSSEVAKGTEVEAATTELQSVLEELGASREELQAINEELISLDEENRRRVQQLTQVSNDLEHLLAATGIATLFLDQELRLVRFTPAFGELFGLRLTDLGRPVSDLTRLVLYDRFEADLQEALAQCRCVDREVAGSNGSWYLFRALPYTTERGRIEGAVLTLVDISERKRAEQAVQESSRQKDEFLAMLAHELRNPLAPISSGIEVLKAASGDRRIIERMTGTMERQTKQLVRLVDDLLEVSRISGGRLHLRKTIIDLNQVIQDAIASVKPSLESAGHTLNLYFTQDPLRVNGDAARLTQVLSNLLNNAVRYTPGPGAISVICSREDDEAAVTVKDNGVGISPEALEHIFEMFYQGNKARPESGAGLGIGLTLAKTLVEMHGGSIKVQSDGENHGSQFTIRLPLVPAHATTEVPGIPEQPHIADEAHKANGDHRILIVDDNVDAAETLCALMQSLGEHEVHTASSGEQALETAPKLHPDIVLLDLMMPDMDGFEVARRMRGQPWGKDVLLVALSGLGHEDHRRRSREAGFDQHLTKPADVAVLKSVLSARSAPA